MKLARILIIFTVLMLACGIAFLVFSINTRLRGTEYQFQVDAILTAASIANGEDPLTTDPALSLTAEYEGRKTVVVPENYLALSSYLKKDAASMLFSAVNRENALKLTVCDIATLWLSPKNGSEDIVFVDLVTKDQTFHVRTDGGNQWEAILKCCMKGTYHDDNIPLE